MLLRAICGKIRGKAARARVASGVCVLPGRKGHCAAAAAGFPSKHILTECAFMSIFENMLFSQKLVEAREKALSAFASCFFATNYHVRCAGLWAKKEGLPAQGAGVKIKFRY